MPSSNLISDKSVSSEILPFYCSSCKTKKRFRSLIALRLHTSIVHETPNLYSAQSNRKPKEENGVPDTGKTSQDVLYDEPNKDLKYSAAASPSDTSGSINEVFVKYDAKINEVMSKYDKQSRKLENKLKLTRQLEEIQRQKKELYRLSRSWKKTQGVSRFLIDNKYSEYDGSKLNEAIYKKSEAMEARASSFNKNLTIKKDETFHQNSTNSTSNNESNVAKQLDLCLELAAQFKSMALDAEKKLQDKIQEEENMKQYLEATAVKEQNAKKKLADLMEELLQRAEYAETQLQAFQGVSNESFQVPGKRSTSTPHHSYSKSHLAKNHLPRSYLEPELFDQPAIPRKQMSKTTSGKLNKSTTARVAANIMAMPKAEHLAFSNQDSKQEANRRVALFCVFTQLRSKDLLRCSMVCREWRDIARHEQLWSRISFHHANIDCRLFQLISKWSKKTCFLSLKNIGLLRHDSSMPGAGLLEEGVEMILQSCGDNLLVLSIDRCEPFLTSRVLWMVSCYNKNICSMSYRSSLDPISHQVAWALGSSCRNIVSLEVAPLQPCSVRGLFTNNVARLLSWCWPNLQALSFGGHDVDGAGLLAVALNCHHLKVLELDHARGITEEQALTVCKHGLKELHTLLFTHTPILPSTLLYFLKSLHLKSLFVVVTKKDYFPRSKQRKIAGEYMKISQGFSKIQRNSAFHHIASIDCH